MDEFQSTPSVWRETTSSEIVQPLGAISIHSLRVKGDFRCNLHSSKQSNFNPLPPCGGRRRFCRRRTRRAKFQSTPSVWRETATFTRFKAHICISIHSLRVEGDPVFVHKNCNPVNFNPLPPCGGRPSRTRARHTLTVFQSTPSVWRETDKFVKVSQKNAISIHSLRVEGDDRQICSVTEGGISIHSLRVEGDLRIGVSLVVHVISIHSLRVEGDSAVSSFTT